MPKVTFIDKNKKKHEIEVPEGANLRDEARKAGIELYNGMDQYLNCRGLGMCGTCRVVVKEGHDNVSKSGLIETMHMNLHPLTMLARLGNEADLRLSCQMKVTGDCTVITTPEFNWNGENFWQKPYPNK